MTQIWQQRLERVEAAKLTKENADALALWCGGSKVDIPVVDGVVVSITVESLGEVITGFEGDYLVKTVDGRYYVGSADMFESMYEPLPQTIPLVPTPLLPPAVPQVATDHSQKQDKGKST